MRQSGTLLAVSSLVLAACAVLVWFGGALASGAGAGDVPAYLMSPP